MILPATCRGGGGEGRVSLTSALMRLYLYIIIHTVCIIIYSIYSSHSEYVEDGVEENLHYLGIFHHQQITQRRQSPSLHCVHDL